MFFCFHKDFILIYSYVCIRPQLQLVKKSTPVGHSEENVSSVDELLDSSPCMIVIDDDKIVDYSVQTKQKENRNIGETMQNSQQKRVNEQKSISSKQNAHETPSPHVRTTEEKVSDNENSDDEQEDLAYLFAARKQAKQQQQQEPKQPLPKPPTEVAADTVVSRFFQKDKVPSDVQTKSVRADIPVQKTIDEIFARRAIDQANLSIASKSGEKPKTTVLEEARKPSETVFHRHTRKISSSDDDKKQKSYQNKDSKPDTFEKDNQKKDDKKHSKSHHSKEERDKKEKRKSHDRDFSASGKTSHKHHQSKHGTDVPEKTYKKKHKKSTSESEERKRSKKSESESEHAHKKHHHKHEVPDRKRRRQSKSNSVTRADLANPKLAQSTHTPEPVAPVNSETPVEPPPKRLKMESVAKGNSSKSFTGVEVTKLSVDPKTPKACVGILSAEAKSAPLTTAQTNSKASSETLKPLDVPSRHVLVGFHEKQPQTNVPQIVSHATSRSWASLAHATTMTQIELCDFLTGLVVRDITASNQSFQSFGMCHSQEDKHDTMYISEPFVTKTKQKQ